MSQGEVTVTPTRFVGSVYIRLAISEPPFYQAGSSEKGAESGSLFQFRQW